MYSYFEKILKLPLDYKKIKTVMSRSEFKIKSKYPEILQKFKIYWSLL